MLTLRYARARQSKSLLCPPSASSTITAVMFCASVDHPPTITPSVNPIFLSSNTNGALAEWQQSNLGYYFREWFLSRKTPFYDRIFEILRNHDGSTPDTALSSFDLRFSERLVLGVLNYNPTDVLSCLKFFDWAGRQPGFYHTKVTFSAIFRILSKAKLTDLLLEFLQNYAKQSYNGKTLYHNVLVIGYAMAGECETALTVFGRMRFRGQDLDPIAYNVLLNSLVDGGHFEFVESLAREINSRGYQNKYTHSIMTKSFCRQNEFEKAEEYLRGLVEDDGAKFNGFVVSTLVSALCKNNQFERASALIEEFKRMGVDMMDHAYSAWIGALVKVGKTDSALEFLKDKEAVDEYVPDVCRFNMLICRLLRENRLEEVYDLLVEMNKRGIVPDDTTMNSVLCFLCKAGMMHTAIGLFYSRDEFGLSINRMAYNYLINTLLGEASAEESYNVLRKSVEQGYFPGERTLSIVADSLCREGKLDKMKELVMFILDQNIKLTNFVYDKFISAFCRVNKVEEGYLLHDLLTRLNAKSQKFAYHSMIHAFCRANRGDMAARLLIEMQDSGYRPSRILFRAVICCLCKIASPENIFFSLLKMQLDRSVFSSYVTFEIFLDGAGYAGKPELAIQVYEMMKRTGHVPLLRASILVLQTYLKSRKVSKALDLFCELSMNWKKRQLWHVMIVGLCRIKEPEYALKMLVNMHKAKATPSVQCYEELIKLFCNLGQYHCAIYLLNDMTRLGRHVSSFIGNVFLCHALTDKAMYDVWISSSSKQNLTASTWMLGHLIGIFSGCVGGSYSDEDILTLISQCFSIDLYTYNMMIRRIGPQGIESACKLVDGLRRRGLEPNRWTYNYIIHGLAINGREEEARKWAEEMQRKEFDFPRSRRKYKMKKVH